MCGRYTLTAEAHDIAAEFGLSEAVEHDARFNIAPTQLVPIVRLHGGSVVDSMAVVRMAEGSATAPWETPGEKPSETSTGQQVPERRLDVLQWGLIPHWSKDGKPAFSTINARAETVATSPAYRDPFRRRRCIVPANGFYEWEKVTTDKETTGKVTKGKKPAKQPYYVRRADGRLMGLAGLWDRWQGTDGEVIESFTIITVEANDIVKRFHDRMPVILRPEDYETWLNPNSKPEVLQGLLLPCPVEWLHVGPVGKQVNNVRNDDPSCIREIT